MGEILGIDTSKHQNSKVNYAAFAKAGGKFVILRVGCGRTKDICFERDYRSAMAAGLKVGAYYYTYGQQVEDAMEDAKRVAEWLAGRNLHLPVVYDLEDPTQAMTSRKSRNTAMYMAFKNMIEPDKKYKTMLYSGEYFFNHYFDREGVEGDLWIAKYSTKKPVVDRDIAIWQFSSSSVNTPYFKGALDRNWMLKDVWGLFGGDAEKKKETKTVNPDDPSTWYTVRVDSTSLNIRKGPGTDYPKLGKHTGQGVFTIVDEADGEGAPKWGLLKSYLPNRNGWVSLEYCRRL